MSSALDTMADADGEAEVVRTESRRGGSGRAAADAGEDTCIGAGLADVSGVDAGGVKAGCTEGGRAAAGLVEAGGAYAGGMEIFSAEGGRTDDGGVEGGRTAAVRHSNNFKKLQAQLRGAVGKAIGDYGMIADGDRVMVCLSGGKDSYTLLDILLSLQRSAPVRFDLLAVNLDQKQPNFPADVLPRYLTDLGVPFHIIEQNTYAVVKRVIPDGKTLCGLCSRLRRGALYRYAAENGITKIALGHHRDDIVETLFLNMFFGGRLKAMPPKLLSEDRRHIVIRPLAYVAERSIARYAAAREFPIIPCTLCGSQTNMQRVVVKNMLREWEEKFPGRVESIFSSLCNASASQLADPALFNFAGLEALREETLGAVSPAGNAYDGNAAGGSDRPTGPGVPPPAPDRRRKIL